MINKRTVAFIDKNSITVPLDRAYWDQAIENFSHVIHRGENLMPALTYSRKGKRQIYEFAWSVKIQGKENECSKCLLQAWPRGAPMAAFIRLDWNPAKAGALATREIIRLLRRCVPNFDAAWEQARLSRVDITFDVRRTHISQLLAFTESSRTTWQPFMQNRGRLNGFYLGTANSNRRLVVYDKVFEKMKGESSVYRNSGSWVRRIQANKTRIEFRLRDLGLIKNIHTLQNQLKRYSIAQVIPAMQLSSCPHWQRFINNCIRHGAQDALKIISGRRRRASYRQYLEVNCTPSWYDKDLVWSEAIIAMRRIFFV